MSAGVAATEERESRPAAKAAAPVILGQATLALHAVPGRTLATAREYAGLDPLAGLSVLGSARAKAAATRAFRGIPDGNRAATLPGFDVESAGRRWALALKGVGAGAPLYGDGPLAGPPLERPILRESWMGESPFGAQGEANARAGIARTDESVGARLYGMPICPVVSVLEVPEPMIEPGHHYRYFSGVVVTEHRLVPSNVRLFHGTGRGLGQAPHQFLGELELASPDRLHAFLEQLIGTGLAALTLFGASLREVAGGLEGLDFDDAWLDKDSLVAGDGALHFVDLESLDWTSVRDEREAVLRIERQLARNAYDLLFAVDGLLRAHELEEERPRTDTARRAHVKELFRLAVDAQRAPWLGFGERGADLLLLLRAPALRHTGASELSLPLITEAPPRASLSSIGGGHGS